LHLWASGQDRFCTIKGGLQAIEAQLIAMYRIIDVSLWMNSNTYLQGCQWVLEICRTNFRLEGLNTSQQPDSGPFIAKKKTTLSVAVPFLSTLELFGGEVPGLFGAAGGCFCSIETLPRTFLLRSEIQQLQPLPISTPNHATARIFLKTLHER